MLGLFILSLVTCVISIVWGLIETSTLIKNYNEEIYIHHSREHTLEHIVFMGGFGAMMLIFLFDFYFHGIWAYSMKPLEAIQHAFEVHFFHISYIIHIGFGTGYMLLIDHFRKERLSSYEYNTIYFTEDEINLALASK